MKLAARVVVLTCLMAVALTMVVFTAAGFRRPAADGTLVLAEYQGSVAVFDSANRETPLQVTDIGTEGLRAADRKLMEVGVTVHTREELEALLEDLGS